MKKYLAELVGTFFLVFFGVGVAVVAGSQVGVVGIAFAFGLGWIAAAYAIGPISGCHINPAVSLGAWVARRITTHELFGYWAGQFIGAIIAAWIVYVIASGVSGGYSLSSSGLGQNGWGAGYQGGYNLTSAIVYEFFATLLFVLVVLGSTQKASPAGFAGVVAGATLIAIHLLGIHITGTGVNPARSLGPALFARGAALSQVWMFLLVPCLGGAVAGWLFRTGVLAAD